MVDDHAHVVAGCSPREAGYLGRGLRAALTSLTEVRWESAHVEEVEDRDHLEHLVGYGFWQPVKHHLSDQPALWSGSCFHDLLGARLLEGFDAGRIFRELPRLGLERQFAAGGVRDRHRPRPVDLREIRAAGAVRLVEAGAAAVCHDDLDGESRPQMMARRAVSSLGATAGIPRSEIAYALGCATVTARRLAAGPADRRLVCAIRLQLGLPEVAKRVELGSLVPKTPWLPPFDERWHDAFTRTRGPIDPDAGPDWGGRPMAESREEARG